MKLQIWDTAGRERFRTITSSYYRGAHGIFLIYDVTDRQSFTSIVQYWKQKEMYARPETACILIGAKKDLSEERVVESIEGKELADSWSIPFIEVSAKDDEGINEAVLLLTDVVESRYVLNGL